MLTEEMLVTNKVLNSNGISNISTERFHSIGQHPCKSIGAKGSVYVRVQLPQEWCGTTYGCVSVFLDNNMATVTSCENIFILFLEVNRTAS